MSNLHLWVEEEGEGRETVKRGGERRERGETVKRGGERREGRETVKEERDGEREGRGERQ